MINNELQQVTETNITEGLNSFQIKATPEMFDMLSKRIYTNEKLAIIRELTTNGIDSMIEANTINSKKLLVHLPDWADPELRIRDFGTGLDDDGMKRVYTYGDTSRNTTNKYVGSFGIGSKSPFAYGDSGFEIISFYNHRKLIYNAFKNNGIPQIIKLGEEETNEENGVEVKLSIEEKDFSGFRKEAKKFYAWFNHLVDINLTECEWDKDEYTYQRNKVLDKPDYTLYEKGCSLFSYSTDCKVYMGGILYELPSMFRSVVVDNVLSNVCVLLKVPVGTFTLPPSREQISGTDANKAKLIELLTNVRTDMFNSFFDEDVKNIEAKNMSNNEIVSYFMADEYKRAKVLWLNDSLYGYDKTYAEIRNHYINKIRTKYPFFEDYVDFYRSIYKNTQKVNIPGTTYYIEWCLPKIPGSRVQNVTSYKWAQNWGTVFFIRDSLKIQWEKFLEHYPAHARFFSCELYDKQLDHKTMNEQIVKHKDDPNYKQPDIWCYNPVQLRKVDPDIIKKIKELIVTTFGMREDQIITSSDINVRFPIPKNTVLTKRSNGYERDKVVDTTLLAKRFSTEIAHRDSYFETHQASELSNNFTYIYEGDSKDAELDLGSDIFNVLGYIKRKLFDDNKLASYSPEITIYLVHKRFEKKIPKDIIDIKKYVEDFLNNYEVDILTDDGYNDSSTYSFQDSYRLKNSFPIYKYYSFYKDRVKGKLNQNEIDIFKLAKILDEHPKEIEFLNMYFYRGFYAHLKTVLRRYHIDEKLVRLKKWVFDDLEKYKQEHPITVREFEDGIWDNYDPYVELLAYEKLDESGILVPFNNKFGKTY